MAKPIYVNSTTLATRCAVTRAAVSNWLARGVIRPPDAYMTVNGNAAPLWLEATAEAIASESRARVRGRIEYLEHRLGVAP